MSTRTRSTICAAALAIGCALLFMPRAASQENPVPPEAKALYEEAEKLAAAGNFPDAQKKLGESADMGYAVAQFELAKLYVNETDERHDDNIKAINLLNKAAAQHYAPAELVLGYLQGMGLAGFEENVWDAEALYEKALEHGDDSVKIEVAKRFYLHESVRYQPKKTIEILTPLADAGNVEAQVVLGEVLAEGSAHYDKDIPRALELFQRAANSGHPTAAYQLAVLCYEGRDVQQNLIQAYGWAKIALAGGVAEGQRMMDAASKVLTPEQLAAAEKLVQDWLKEHGK